MSSNSYPSPISSSAPSPQFNTTPIDPLVPFQPHRTRQAQADRPLTPPHDIDTVAASVRTRLEQVRSDLLGFSNGLQEPASQLRPRGGVGPTHEAIMLTGEPSGETPTSEDTSSNMSTQELIDAYDYSFRRVVQAQSSLALMAEQASFLRQSIDHIPTPPIEPPAHGRFRHQPLPLQSPRTLGPSLTDDSFTTMGRRVAAREHAAQQSRALSRTDTLPADDPPDAPRTTQPSTRFVPGELQRDVSLAAREVELQTIQSRQLRQEAELQAIQTRQLRQEIELQNAEAMRLRRELSELQLQSIEARRLSQVPTHLASPTNLGGPLLWRQEPRRRRLIRPEPRPSSTGSRSSGSGSGAGTGSTLSSEQSRLSILSGSLHDMQNFSSPASATPSMFPGTRSLIFEEPENWVESPRGVMDNADIMVDEVSNGRNYLVRRRITPEGTERVQNVTLPEPTDADLLDFYGPRDLPNELEAARRRTMLQAFHDRTSRAPSMLSLTNQTIPRRRGWGESDSPLSTWGQAYLARRTARLDADGNEVPPDEEEEFLERNSAELRVRRARDAPAGPLLFDPDSASRPGPQTFGGSLERTVEGLAARGPVDHSEVPRRQRTTGDLIDKPDVRRRLDPLPMALDGMVASSKCARYLDDDPVVVVGRWASFAGR